MNAGDDRRRSEVMDLVGALGRLVPGMLSRGPEVQAVLNGLHGDTFAELGVPLAVPMSLRTRTGQLVAAERAELARLLPDVTDELCLFVHGLMCTESVWVPGDRNGVDPGARLHDEHGVTPLYLRYNTGLHVSTNGRQLAGLLTVLQRCWPRRLRRIDLVGHSMGGLVIRSACHYGSTLVHGWNPVGRRWTRRVRRIVLLGTPNTGARAEVLINLASRRLSSLPSPVTHLLGRYLDLRSEGIQDLRFGFVVDEDWQERERSMVARPALHPVRSPRRARVLAIAGSVGAHEHSPLALLLGDALVTASSAAGEPPVEGAAALLPGATMRSCTGVDHLSLPHHRAVYDEIDRWW